MTRIFNAAGVDYIQWRALTRSYLIVDYAVLFGAYGSREAVRAILNLLLACGVAALVGLGPAAVVLFSHDLLFAATLMATMTALAVAVGAVALGAEIAAPEDREVLGFRPIGSRTYFVVRATGFLLSAGQTAVLVGWVPVAAFAVRTLSPGPVAGAIAANLAIALAVTLAVLLIHSVLVRVVPPARLARAMAFANVLATFAMFAGYGIGFSHFVDRATGSPLAVDFNLQRNLWAFLYPGTWFASYVEVFGGTADGREPLAAALSVVLLAVLAVALRGRLSGDYADRIAEIAIDAAPRPDRSWVPGFLQREARAVAILVTSQLRGDITFQIAVMTNTSMLIVIIAMSLWGSLPADPFFSDAVQGESFAMMIHFGGLYLGTLTYHSMMTSAASDASWPMFTTPADRVRLVEAGRDLVFVVVVLPVLLALTCFMAFAYGHAGHALLQGTLLGGTTYALMQVQVLMKPRIPFSVPITGRRASAGTGMFLISLLAMPLALLQQFFIYRTPLRVAIALAGLAGLILFLNKWTRRRIERGVNAVRYS